MPVPFCGACQEGNQVQYRTWLRKRVSAAFTGPLLVGLLIAPLVVFRNPGAWLFIELLILVLVSLPGALIAYVLARMAGKRRLAPVRVEALLSGPRDGGHPLPPAGLRRAGPRRNHSRGGGTRDEG